MRVEPVRISVITVTYNCEDVIAATLDSVARQSYAHVEHVIVDGRSSDSTFSIISGHSSPRVSAITEPDSGLYDAMNKGLARATGDYCFFLNGGDVFAADDVLERIVAGVDNREAILFGYVRIMTKLGHWFAPYEGSSYQIEAAYLPHHQSIFYPANFFRSHRFDLAFPTHADILFTAQARKICRAIFRPVHIVDSTMGGFATNLFRNRDRISPLIEELSSIDAILSGDVSSRHRKRVTRNSYVKYFTCRCFGDIGLYQLYRINGFFGALSRKKKNTKQGGAAS
jgi:glycosyltransferase involved in cell wall biosynthesis